MAKCTVRNYYSQYLNCKILHGGTLLQPWLNLSEDQACSQDFAKEEAFLKLWTDRKRTWPHIFIALKLDWGNFSVKIRWSPPRFKYLRRDSKAFSGQNQKFEGFFRPKTGVLQKKKKKKRSSLKFKGFFWAESEILRAFPAKNRCSPK